MSETTQTKQSAPKADISFEVGFGTDLAQFNMRFITLEEETESAQRLTETADAGAEKRAREYEVMLNELVNFSQNKKDGEKLRELFAEQTNKNDRIIRSAYWQFRGALLPTVNFR